jgi:hypothetical protein
MNAPAATQSAFAAALLDPERALPEGLVAWNGSDPERRFAVYRNNVFASLIAALRAKFPITAELVGEEFFNAMAALFIRETPPAARILARYGEDFATFVDGFEPARSLPYLGDMLRFEALRLAVYRAADEAPLDAEAFGFLAGADLAAARIRFRPSLAIQRSRFAIFSLFAAHRGDLQFGAVDPYASEAVLLTRPQDEVIVTILAPDRALFLDMLAHGATLAEAWQGATDISPAFDLTSALAALISGELVAGIFLKESVGP